MAFSTVGVVIALVLFIGLSVPYFIWYQRSGKANGHTWFNWRKPLGHSDIGPDMGGSRQTRPGADDARGKRY
jgi:hypothetical protein